MKKRAGSLSSSSSDSHATRSASASQAASSVVLPKPGGAATTVSAFSGMAPVHRRGHTDLVGEIADQAQLHGLLSRIRDLGLELEHVTVLADPEQPPSPRAQT